MTTFFFSAYLMRGFKLKSPYSVSTKSDLLEEMNSSRASGGECWVAGAFKADDLHLAHVDVSARCLPCAAPRLWHGVVHLPWCAGKMEALTFLFKRRESRGQVPAVGDAKRLPADQLLMPFSWSRL